MTHDKYDTDILKELKCLRGATETIAKTLSSKNGIFKDKNMDNEFFNFDAVLEIEKKKSYNQAIEDFFMKAIEAYHDDKLNECELCNIERRLKEKSIK